MFQRSPPIVQSSRVPADSDRFPPCVHAEKYALFIREGDADRTAQRHWPHFRNSDSWTPLRRAYPARANRGGYPASCKAIKRRRICPPVEKPQTAGQGNGARNRRSDQIRRSSCVRFLIDTSILIEAERRSFGLGAGCRRPRKFINATRLAPFCPLR